MSFLWPSTSFSFRDFIISPAVRLRMEAFALQGHVADHPAVFSLILSYTKQSLESTGVSRWHKVFKMEKCRYLLELLETKDTGQRAVFAAHQIQSAARYHCVPGIMGLDEMQPWVRRELACEVAKALSIIFEKSWHSS